MDWHVLGWVNPTNSNIKLKLNSTQFYFIFKIIIKISRQFVTDISILSHQLTHLKFRVGQKIFNF